MNLSVARGAATTVKIDIPTKSWHFAMTALDAQGNESDIPPKP